MKVKPRGIEIPLIILISVLSVFVLGTLGLLIYRLGQSGIFQQDTVAQTEVETTRRAASITTAAPAGTDSAESETTSKEETEAAATEAATTAAETEKESETTTASETKPETTKAPETKPAETKAAETKPAKSEKDDQKQTTAKVDGGKKDDTKNETEKDPVAIYQKYVKDELIPKFGLAPVGEGKRPENGEGLSSVLIRDFSNSGELELLVVRLENYSSICSVYPVFALYGIKDGEVHKLGERSCDYAMSEWAIRVEGSKVFLRSKMSDVNGVDADLRINMVDIGLANHNVVITTDSYTIGDPNGPAPTYTENALWVAELLNEVTDANLLNEGRLYTLTDYTGLRDWVK